MEAIVESLRPKRKYLARLDGDKVLLLKCLSEKPLYFWFDRSAKDISFFKTDGWTITPVQRTAVVDKQYEDLFV